MSKRLLVQRQEPAVVLLHDMRRVLDRMACRLTGSSLFQDVGGRNVTHGLGTVGRRPWTASRPAQGLLMPQLKLMKS